MTFRARPTTRTGRRSGYESDHRRNLYFNIGFGAVIVTRRPAARRRGRRQLVRRAPRPGGHGQRRDDHQGRSPGARRARDVPARHARVADAREGQRRPHVGGAGHAAAQLHRPAEGADRQRRLRARDRHDAPPPARPQAGRARSAPADIDAQVTKDATTPESRHTYQIQVDAGDEHGRDASRRRPRRTPRRRRPTGSWPTSRAASPGRTSSRPPATPTRPRRTATSTSSTRA